MIKTQKLFTPLVVAFSILLNGCSQPQEELVYDGSLSSVQEQTPIETSPYYYVLEQINPDAYNNVQTLYLDPGSTISIIGMENNTPYWNAVQQGAKDAIAALNTSLGYEGKDAISLTYNAPASKYGVDEQINILDEELSRFPTAIGMAMLDAQAYEVQFDLALENGIPVVAFDSSNNYSNIASSVGTNHTEGTIVLTNHLAQAMNATGELILIADNMRTASSIERVEVIRDTIVTNYPNITLTTELFLDNLDVEKLNMLRITNPEIIDSATSALAEQDAQKDAELQDISDIEDSSASEEVSSMETLSENESPTDEDSSTEQNSIANNDDLDSNTSKLIEYLSNELAEISTEEVLQHVLVENPNTAGFLCTSNTACELLLAQLESTPLTNKPAITSFDIGSTSLAQLESGTIDSLLLQNPYGMGYSTVIACIRAATNSGNEAIVDTGYTLLTADNLTECKEKNKIYIP